MNAKQRYRAKRSAQYHAEQRDRLAGMKDDMGCSSRVANAISGPALRDKYSGSICLPDVAIYQAGHRKSVNITAR